MDLPLSFTTIVSDKKGLNKLNDRVSYKGVVYKVKDQATGQGAQNYTPSDRPNVWQKLS
jgi:hypothetical protein